MEDERVVESSSVTVNHKTHRCETSPFEKKDRAGLGMPKIKVSTFLCFGRACLNACLNLTLVFAFDKMTLNI